jgi:nitroimidazol reductase NimA-like FMN-containing flavoprotein (pyridoxamine 5'-phosphate oxidase superfamily)
MSHFELTDKNRVKRVPERGVYDKDTIYDIVDQSLIGHVAFIVDGEPYVIPTLITRQDDSVLIHGATSSRMMRHIATGGALSIAVTHVDALVLARSVFHHSINYRSAVLFGSGALIEEPQRKLEALKQFTERLIPGRWQDCRTPNENELKATAVADIPIDLASAKIRSGYPGDEEEDYALPYWAGIVPVRQVFGDPIADPELPSGIDTPAYILDLAYSQRD